MEISRRGGWIVVCFEVVKILVLADFLTGEGLPLPVGKVILDSLGTGEGRCASGDG